VTNLWQFEMALFALMRLDMQELVDAGAIADRDYLTWDTFQADRVSWFLMNPAAAPAVWQAIWKHKPSSQLDEPPQTQDNVVDLKKVRRKEKR
jgi:hypothetical protein